MRTTTFDISDIRVFSAEMEDLLVFRVYSCRGKSGKWSTDDMDQALSAIRNGDMGLNAVARAYDINKSTIKRHLNKTNAYANDDVRYFGHPSVFSAEMEDLLDKHILKLDSLLFGISPIELAGKKWHYSCLKRHPCLS